MHSTSATASRASSVIATQSRPESRNWDASFADLTSHYGFGGSVPSIPKSTTKKAMKESSASVERRSTPPQPKNYEAAFGQLFSQFGLSGGSYSPPIAQRSS